MRSCFACGSFETEKHKQKNGKLVENWYPNHDTAGNALCKRCYNYYIRRPPKRLTTAYRESIKNRRCYECGNSDPNPNGKEKYWMRNKEKEGWLCVRCYAKLYRHPMNNPRRFAFRDKIVFAIEFPRIGVCNLCRAIRGEVDAQTGKLCQFTGLHHEKYEADNPQAHTIEVCNRCHGKITGASKVERNKKRRCYCCGSDKTDLVKGKHPSWILNHDVEDNALCMKCFRHLIATPARRKQKDKDLALFPYPLLT